MDRRTYIKAMTLGTLGAVTVASTSCEPGVPVEGKALEYPALNYDRTPEELDRDQKMLTDGFFDEHEMKTITVLGDIILPKDEVSCSASEAGVPAFIDFIVQDMPGYQTPIRGGIKWLDLHCLKKFNSDFISLTNENKISVVDEIAFPEKASPEVSQGVQFFNTMRDLTLTGFYTSKQGLVDLDYQGNKPNAWDGVPEDVLKQYNIAYDPKYASVYINQNEV